MRTRSMLASALALLCAAGTAALLAPVPAQADPGGGQPACQPYTIIGARGSGQAYDGPYQPPWAARAPRMFPPTMPTATPSR